MTPSNTQFHNTVSAEQVARQFHQAYEELAPSFGYETRTETRAFDPSTPNGQLMVATCRRVLTNLGASHIAERLRAAKREYAALIERHPRLIPLPPQDPNAPLIEPRKKRPGPPRTEREAELIKLLDYIFLSVDEAAAETVLADPEPTVTEVINAIV